MPLPDDDLAELVNALCALALGLSAVLASLDEERRAYARDFLTRMRDGQSLAGERAQIARELLAMMTPVEGATHEPAPEAHAARLWLLRRPRGGGG
jgi:hypothetical protein